jgi:hypothetical protein
VIRSFRRLAQENALDIIRAHLARGVWSVAPRGGGGNAHHPHDLVDCGRGAANSAEHLDARFS